MTSSLLTIRGHGSNLHFAVYEVGPTLTLSLRGSLDGIGAKESTLRWQQGDKSDCVNVVAADHAQAAKFLLDWLELEARVRKIASIGHALGALPAAQRLTPPVLDELADVQAQAALVAAFAKLARHVPQVLAGAGDDDLALAQETLKHLCE